MRHICYIDAMKYEEALEIIGDDALFETELLFAGVRDPQSVQRQLPRQVHRADSTPAQFALNDKVVDHRPWRIAAGGHQNDPLAMAAGHGLAGVTVVNGGNALAMRTLKTHGSPHGGKTPVVMESAPIKFIVSNHPDVFTSTTGFPTERFFYTP